jgi:hypothetical protein
MLPMMMNARQYRNKENKSISCCNADQWLAWRELSKKGRMDSQGNKEVFPAGMQSRLIKYVQFIRSAHRGHFERRYTTGSFALRNSIAFILKQGVSSPWSALIAFPV